MDTNRKYHIYSNEGEESEMEMSEGEKDIGVLVNRKDLRNTLLKKAHKANNIVGLIRRTYIFLDKTSFRYLFQALIRPNLEYVTAVWSPYTKKDI